MKILISSDGTHAHYYQRMSWINAFRSFGIQATLWDCKSVSAFDAFDSFEPDLFLGQSYNLTPDLVKCIYERPHLKVGLRSGDWGDQEQEVDKSKYNILYCSKAEKELLKKLKEETGQPDFVHIHYDDQAIRRTHNHFETIGIKAVSIMMCADTSVYSNAEFKEELNCDIGFVGGYWPYKGQVINKYLFPLLDPLGKYKAKIFGNQPWPVNQYCGLIDDDQVKNLFLSAKICPNLSEPHAQKFGIDVNERIFKTLCSGGFCISDYAKSYEMFGDGVVLAKTPEDFKDKIDYYLKNKSERLEISKRGQKYVRENHTGFHRISKILKSFGHEDLAKKIIEQYKETINED
tara:strand:- start:226 stop:1266 length:1041 start_codon:yes stop_codon:yes gene_type:complete